MIDIFDTESESYHKLIETISHCEWLDSEEREKLIVIAPILTENERTQIVNSLEVESALVLKEKRSGV